MTHATFINIVHYHYDDANSMVGQPTHGNSKLLQRYQRAACVLSQPVPTAQVRDTRAKGNW